MDNTIEAWRNYNRIYSLVGQQCTSCNKIYYPRAYLCQCNSKNFKNINLSGNGNLITFTQINYPHDLFKENSPYLLGIIKLNEDVKIISQITDANLEDLYIGMPLKAVFRKLFSRGETGVIQYGIKFTPQK